MQFQDLLNNNSTRREVRY